MFRRRHQRSVLQDDLAYTGFDGHGKAIFGAAVTI